MITCTLSIFLLVIAQNLCWDMQTSEYLGYGKFRVSGDDNRHGTASRVWKEVPGVEGRPHCVNIYRENEVYSVSHRVPIPSSETHTLYLTEDLEFVAVWMEPFVTPVYMLPEDKTYDRTINTSFDIKYCYMWGNIGRNFKIERIYAPYWLDKYYEANVFVENVTNVQNFWRNIFNNDSVRINSPPDYLQMAYERNETLVDNTNLYGYVTHYDVETTYDTDGIEQLLLSLPNDKVPMYTMGLKDYIAKIHYFIELKKINLVVGAEEDEIYLIKSVIRDLRNHQPVPEYLVPVLWNDSNYRTIPNYFDLSSTYESNSLVLKNGVLKNSMPFFRFESSSGFLMEIAEVALFNDSLGLFDQEMFMLKKNQSEIVEALPSIDGFGFMDPTLSPTTRKGGKYVLFSNLTEMHGIEAYVELKQPNTSLLNWTGQEISYISNVSNSYDDLDGNNIIVPIFSNSSKNHPLLDSFTMTRNSFDGQITLKSIDGDLHFFDHNDNLSNVLDIAFFVSLEPADACNNSSSSIMLNRVVNVTKSMTEAENYAHAVPIHPNSTSHEEMLANFEIYTDSLTGRLHLGPRSNAHTLLFTEDLSESQMFALFVELNEESGAIKKIYRDYPMADDYENFRCIELDSEDYETIVEGYRFPLAFESIDAEDFVIQASNSTNTTAKNSTPTGLIISTAILGSVVVSMLIVVVVFYAAH